MPSSERILLFGARGQFGHDIARAGEAAGHEIVPVGRSEADVRQADAVRETVRGARPALVVNCAALHQVDACEDMPQEAFDVNAMGALHVARAAHEAGARLLHVSTDYVFAGEKPPPVGALDPSTSCLEEDPTRPLNVYGASKLAGEHLVRAAHAESLVVRVASLFGVAGARSKGGNFVETMIRLAREGKALRVVDDQWMTPTYTADAAPVLLEAGLDARLRGVLHVANHGATTWHRFAVAALEGAGIDHPIAGIPAAEYPTKAARPPNSSLNTQRLAAWRGAPLRGWREALDAYLRAKGHAPG